VSTDSNPVAWSPAEVSLELGAQEVHLWRASLDCEISALSRLEATLSADELARADRFVFKTDRSYFVAARGILRELLGAYLMLSPTELQFCYGNHGKPALDPETDCSGLQFNLSHSGGVGVYAFSHGRKLGIDVEQIRPQLAGEDIARRYFAARELAELRALPPQLRVTGFFLCWTRKEAYVKAHGAGLSIPLDSFVVSLTPGRPPELHSVDSAQWSLRSFEPSPGYVAAIVGEGRSWQLRYWNWRSR
jgi:4'-phosphopantetheinyl transferase